MVEVCFLIVTFVNVFMKGFDKSVSMIWDQFKASTSASTWSWIQYLVWSNANACSSACQLRSLYFTSRNSEEKKGKKISNQLKKIFFSSTRGMKPHFRVKRVIKANLWYLNLFLHFEGERVWDLPMCNNDRLKNTWLPSQQDKDINHIY